MMAIFLFNDFVIYSVYDCTHEQAVQMYIVRMTFVIIQCKLYTHVFGTYE